MDERIAFMVSRIYSAIGSVEKTDLSKAWFWSAFFVLSIAVLATVGCANNVIFFS